MLKPSERNQKNKALVWDYWQRLNWADNSEVPTILAKAFHRDVNWNGSHPINRLQGVHGLLEGFWLPLRAAFPDLKRRTDIFLGGSSEGEEYVTGTGHLVGTFVHDWLGIPATGEKVCVNFGQHYILREGQIAESYLILDLLSLMRQAGFQVLPPGRGAEGSIVPGPHTCDGVLLAPEDPLEGERTTAMVNAMLDGLWRYQRNRDADDLGSSAQEHYWTPGMHWYGPTGIGWCLNLEQFKDFQQRPWVRAFGDRLWDKPHPNARTLALVSEGRYASLGIWDYEFSVHHGAYLGIPATNRLLRMRDFDWYRREGNRIAQNWVPIDMIDLLRQMDVDVFERLRQLVEYKRQGKRWYDSSTADSAHPGNLRLADRRSLRSY